MSMTPMYDMIARPAGGGVTIYTFGPGMTLQSHDLPTRVKMIKIPGVPGGVDISDGEADTGSIVLGGTMRAETEGYPLIAAIATIEATLKAQTDYDLIIAGTTVPVIKCSRVRYSMVFGTGATEANVTCTFVTDPSR